MGESGDQSYVPVLVEFLRFPLAPRIPLTVRRLLLSRAAHRPTERGAFPRAEGLGLVGPLAGQPPRKWSRRRGLPRGRGSSTRSLSILRWAPSSTRGVPTRIRLEEIRLGRRRQGRHPGPHQPAHHLGRGSDLPGALRSRLRCLLQQRAPSVPPPHPQSPRRWPTTWWAECHSPWPTEPSAALESCIPQSSMAKPWSSGPQACSTGATS